MAKKVLILMEASEVPIARCITELSGKCNNVKMSRRAGTVTVPPPIPKSPEESPAITPIIR